MLYFKNKEKAKNFQSLLCELKRSQDGDKIVQRKFDIPEFHLSNSFEMIQFKTFSSEEVIAKRKNY